MERGRLGVSERRADPANVQLRVRVQELLDGGIERQPVELEYLFGGFVRVHRQIFVADRSGNGMKKR